MPGPLYRNVHLADGGILSVAALDLQPQQVLSTAMPTPAQVGMLAYATDTFQLLQYQSATTGWTPPWNLAWGIAAAATTTASAGTISAGATETRDAVLGNYVFTAVANRLYEVVLTGAGMTTTVAADNDAVRVRDGGASTPTSASTLLAETRVTVPATATLIGCPVRATFTATAGTHTLSTFTARVAGTGNCQVQALGPSRQLYVADIGPAANPA